MDARTVANFFGGIHFVAVDTTVCILVPEWTRVQQIGRVGVLLWIVPTAKQVVTLVKVRESAKALFYFGVQDLMDREVNRKSSVVSKKPIILLAASFHLKPFRKNIHPTTTTPNIWRVFELDTIAGSANPLHALKSLLIAANCTGSALATGQLFCSGNHWHQSASPIDIMDQQGSSSHAFAMQPANLFTLTATEDQAFIDYLYNFFERRVSKKKIKNSLEAAQGNRDMAFDLLFSSHSSGEDTDEHGNEDDDAQQAKIKEYDEVINGITDPIVRRNMSEIIGICPSESPRHILNIYRHFNGNKNDAISALLDGFVVPTEKFGAKIKEEDSGKGKGKEPASGNIIKSQPSGSFSNDPFPNLPRRKTSSDSESHPRYTPTSSSNSSSPQRGLSMRTVAGAEWSFGDLPPLPDSPKIPACRVKTDDDGFDLDEDSDLDMLPVKDENENEEDIYGLPAEDKATGSRKVATPEFSSPSSDENKDVNMPRQNDETSFESDSEHEDDDSDIDMCSDAGTLEGQRRACSTDLTRDESENEDEEVELSQEEKEAHLLSLFPKAGMEGVRRELQLNEGRMAETAADLENEYGLGGSSDPERSISPEISPCRPRESESQKRPAGNAVVGDRQSKRSRWFEEQLDADQEESTHESADKWVLSFLHADSGVQIELDSGMHPCRIPEAALRRIPFFRGWLDANPPQIGTVRTMKVPDVSLETFNLGMQWIVCSVGRFTANQHRYKANELTALIELAVFAETVGLSIGSKTEWFMSTLKSTLVKYRNALRGSHIRGSFEKLRKGHQVRRLLVQASLKPYVLFHHSGEDNKRTFEFGFDSDSDADYSNLNPAQQAAYRKHRFCFEKEFITIEDFQTDLLREFHRVWWSRSTGDHKYSTRHYCSITTVVDPLTDESFPV
ncbi:hypothetical protein BKA64DRAFT_717855 [Cadophora sp. MPI-SDFR-AT-0126]|nr:hypothetical protein BKA64DRAFT_717855 [Leotiomycetes sp. MPI-SDFR-AT-0126]